AALRRRLYHFAVARSRPLREGFGVTLGARGRANVRRGSGSRRRKEKNGGEVGQALCGAAFQAADPLSSGSSRPEGRQRPGLAAPQQFLPQQHQTLSSAAFTRAAVNGTVRSLTPVASN